MSISLPQLRSHFQMPIDVSNEVVPFWTTVGASLGYQYDPFLEHLYNKKQFPELSIRMIKEAEKTINLANHIIDKVPNAMLELHLDISPQENNEGTSHLANMLVGYVKGSGYECRIKPYAFAAASIADKHSK